MRRPKTNVVGGAAASMVVVVGVAARDLRSQAWCPPGECATTGNRRVWAAERERRWPMDDCSGEKGSQQEKWQTVGGLGIPG